MDYEKILIDGIFACRIMKHDDLVGGLVDYFQVASTQPEITKKLNPKSFLSGCLGQAEAWRDKITNQLVNDKLHHERELSNYIVQQETNGLPFDDAIINLITNIIEAHGEQIVIVKDDFEGLRYQKSSHYIRDDSLRYSVGSNGKLSYWEVNLLIEVIKIARSNASNGVPEIIKADDMEVDESDIRRSIEISKTDNRQETNWNSGDDEDDGTFEFILKCENKKEVMNAIRKKIEGKKGKAVTIIIMALEDKGYLTVQTRGLDKIRIRMKRDFGDVGSKEGVSKYYRKNLPNGKPLVPQSEIDKAADNIP